LLEELRQSLRAELQLGQVPRREVWLRINRDDPWVADVALVRARVAVLTAAAPSPPNDLDAAGSADELRRSLIAAHEDVISDVAACLAARVAVVPGTADAVVASALAQRLITRETADAVEGLAVLRSLVERGQRTVTRDRLDDYASLCAATRYAVRMGVARPPV
jgi:hypothetical protein